MPIISMHSEYQKIGTGRASHSWGVYNDLCSVRFFVGGTPRADSWHGTVNIKKSARGVPPTVTSNRAPYATPIKPKSLTVKLRKLGNTRSKSVALKPNHLPSVAAY